MPNYLRAFLYLRRMMKRAYWDRNRLVEYQNTKLRKIIKYAYDCVPFYHKRLENLGIRPDDIKTVNDLNKLPILRKEEIRKNVDEMISKDFNMDDLKMLSTSGSTGQPLFLYISRKEDDFRKAKHLRANISLGQKSRDRWVTITSPHHFGNTTRLQWMLGFYVPIPVSVFDDAITQISTIERMKPDILDGYSSSLLLLAKEVEKRGVETIEPRFVIGGAELIDDSSRRFIEEVFGAPFYDQYASVELERTAWQCPVKMGYHMDVDSMIVQFVDKNGEEVSEGERGEITCTSLFNYSMPLIRYAVGDVGIPSDEKCSCGRTLPVMKVVEGRKDSLLLLPDGRILTPRTLTIAINMFKLYDRIDKFRVIQKRIDCFELQVKMKDDDMDRDVFELAVVEHLKKMIDIGSCEIRFDVRFVEDIPLDGTGKFMMVISKLGKKFDAFCLD